MFKNIRTCLSEFYKNNFIVLIVALLLSLLCLFVFFKRIFIVIPAGHLGVIYKPFFDGIDESIVLDEGLAVIFPWNEIYQYDARLQSHHLDIEVLTNDQLKTKVSLNFQFSINPYTLPILHKYIGKDYKQTIVEPQVVLSAREIFGRLTSTDAFTTSINDVVGDIAIDTDRTIVNHMSPPGLDAIRLVSISGVQLESIEFPSEMQDAIQSKLVQLQNSQSYKYRIDAAKQEVERKVIEANGIKKYQDIVNSGLTESYLRLRGIEATEKISESPNSKLVLIGSGSKGLPIIYGSDPNVATTSNAHK